MATQTVEFVAESGLTLTVKRFAVGSDTEIDSVAATEQTNRKGKYRVSYTDAPAAEYEIYAFDGTTVAAFWYVTLLLSTATFQAYDRASSTSSLDINASPTIERVDTDTDNIRFSWPSDSATITGEVSKAGGAYAAVAGAITQRADEGTTFWYQLAYDAADRQSGSQRYRFTDGVTTRYVNLLVLPAPGDTWAEVIESGYTASEILRLLAAFAAGSATGLTDNAAFTGLDGATTRITGTIAGGTRTITALDGV